MWTAADAKATMLHDPSIAEEAGLFSTLTDLLREKKESAFKINPWVGVAAGVAGITALVAKLLASTDFDFKLPSLSDIKAKVLGPETVEAKDQTQAVAAPSAPVVSKAELDQLQVTEPTQPVMSIIDNAAKVVGIDKALLLAIAHQESRFNVNAKAKTSSALGLFQLVSGTWQELVKKYGKQYGITNRDIKVPEKNAILGACYVRDIVRSLRKTLGKEPSVTDVYAGFFLGATGARMLLDSLKGAPTAIAAEVMPRAAKANKNIFFTAKGVPKTVAEVYATLYGKVGKQYLKFAQQTNTPVTMAAADTTVLLPDNTAKSSPSVTAAAPTFSGGPAKTTVANTEAVPVSFDSLPKQPVQVAIAPTEASQQSSGVALSGPSPKKQPSDYYRTSNGNVLALTG